MTPGEKKVVEMGAPTNAAPVIIKRKKVSGGDGHHGGAWKVAYADFVTAMMAFFMLMWLLNATTEKQRKGLADYFSPSVPISRESGGGSGAFGGDSLYSEESLLYSGTGASAQAPTEGNAARGNLGLADDGSETDATLREVEKALSGRGGDSLMDDRIRKHIATRVTDEGLVIELFDTEDAALFEPDSNRPTPLLGALAQTVSEAAALVPNGAAIEGHTRARPIVQAENPVWELSATRAGRVRELLESAGFAPKRIRRVTGHADRKPAVPDPMSVRNNRIEVILLRNDVR